jgi:beta-glucosidase
MRTLNGAWTYSWQGEKTEEFADQYNTILEAVQNEIGKDKVVYFPGINYVMDGNYYEDEKDQFKEAIAAAQEVDYILLCIGENSYTEKPGDLNDLYLSDNQTELAAALAATGKPVILILNEGRPRIISKFEKNVDGIIQTYLPGNFGGDALADILFGDVNPSGKLPYNYPRYPNALIPYIHKPSEEQTAAEGVYNYEADYNPQFSFGDGLSYTTFEVKGLELESTSIPTTGAISLEVKVTNTGKIKGKEVIEVYTSDRYASGITPDVKRLRRFTKVELEPGETKTISFTIDAENLAYINKDGKSIVEPGEFEIMIKDLKQTFEIVQ